MPTLIVIGGPTASGKTSLAIALAKHLQTEIISADSRQFYQEMEIGTARPNTEELATVKHHFIADRSVTKALSAGQFAEEALSLTAQLFQQYEQLVCVGGSGLFIQALCEGLDQFPDVTDQAKTKVEELWTSAGLPGLQQALASLDPVYYQQVDLQNPRRLQRALAVCYSSEKAYSSFLGQTSPRPFDTIYFRTDPDRDSLYERINLRVDQMLEQGLIEEVKALLPYQNLPALQTVGYQEFWPYFKGEYALERSVELIKRNSRRYAKRQFTWFKRGGKYQPVKDGKECLQHIYKV